jgi:hypothetical protein
MILGYDFVEERLFAFRDYANLSEEGLKYLRKERSEIAKWLKDCRNSDKLLRRLHNDRAVRESNGSVDKLIANINRRYLGEKNLDGSFNFDLINYANPKVFQEEADDILRIARARAKDAAKEARNM